MKDSRWERTEFYCNEVGGLNNWFIQGRVSLQGLVDRSTRGLVHGPSLQSEWSKYLDPCFVHTSLSSKLW